VGHEASRLREHWDREARRKLAAGRHPLAFESLTTIADHATHLRTVAYLAKTARPAIVIATSGMCGGGRMRTRRTCSTSSGGCARRRGKCGSCMETFPPKRLSRR